MWFRAVFEISSRRNGISAKELQRIMGFGLPRLSEIQHSAGHCLRLRVLFVCAIRKDYSLDFAALQ
jgi:hypothetical protein